MKTLFVLRHAKAARDSESGKDIDRPLTDRGEKDARRMGKAMRKAELEAEKILSSPAVRTRQTVESFLEKYRRDVPVEYREEIYEATGDRLRRLLTGQAEGESILLVGHNPGLEELVRLLTGGASHVAMPTAGLAQIEFDVTDWSELTNSVGSLCLLLTPDVVAEL